MRYSGCLLGTREAEEVAGLLLDEARPCGQGKGLLGGDGGNEGVSGEGGEVVEKGSEAVDREAVLGSAGGLLGDGGGGALGFGDDAGALRLGGILVGVVVEHMRQALAHMPFQVVGEHADKHVGAHAIGQPVIDRPDLEIDGLDAAEGALHQAKGFVAAHRGGVVESGGGQAGTHDVEAVERRLPGNFGGLSGEAEAGFGNVGAKCLAILCLSSTAPISRPISALPRSGWRLRATAAAMRARSRSVAASRSSRLRARSAASARLRQTISRSPGNSGEVMAAISRSSNSDICRAPPSSNALIAGARKAVIQSSPAGLISSLIRAWVIMPRSPTRTTWSRAKRSFSLVT